MTDDEGPCDVCGQQVDMCLCPPCPVCGQYGNPVCYDDHGLIRTQEQVNAKQAAIEFIDLQSAAEFKQLMADYDQWMKDISSDTTDH